MDKYAVMTFFFQSWWADGQLSHERTVEGLAGLQVQAIEPFHTIFVEDPGLIPRYQKALGDHGMRVSAVDVICDLVYSSPKEKRKGRDNLRQGLEVCAALGAEVAHVAGHAPKKGISPADSRKMIADGLQSQAEFAEAHRLTLAIEDYGFTPTLLCKAEDCLATLKLSGDSVRFVFDVGNFAFAGERADTNLDALYDHICYVHFKDVRPASDRRPGDLDLGYGFVGCPLGEGIVPGAEVARMLKGKGYSGWVALECGSSLDDPFSAVRRDMDILKRWLS